MLAASLGTASSSLAQPAEPAAVPRQLVFGPSEAILLRSTLIGVNLSNATGEYALLRGIMTPDASGSVSVEALTALFAPWRERQRDFGFAAIADAELSEPPSLSQDGELKLTGSVPTPSFKLGFDLAYAKVSNRWLLKRFSFSDGAITVRSADIPAAEPTRRTAVPARTVAAPTVVPVRIPPLPPTRPWY